MNNFIGKRTKHGFDFNSIDNKFPYKIEEIDVGSRKPIIFKYSSIYFRRKQASVNTLYEIYGGNIPYDLNSTITVEVEPTGGNTELPPPIICNLNKGSAVPTGILNISGGKVAVNLSPNNLYEVPTICDAPYPEGEEIIFEKGLNQKPNFMYVATYQNSCSKHPRSKGLAHEDNYTCLKKNIGNGFINGVCCDKFCSCSTYFEGYRINPLSNKFDRCPSVRKGTPNFSICSNTVSGFCCGSTPDVGFGEDFGKNLCSEDTCNFGYHIAAPGGTDLLLKICPSSITDDGYQKNPYDGGYAKVYLVSGNKNCGCSGAGGKVILNGTKECTWCQYQLIKINDDGSFSYKTELTYNCNDPQMKSNPRPICACIFNDKKDFGDGLVFYITTMNIPTFKYADGQDLEITENGDVKSVGCDNAIIYGCDDLN